MANTATFTSTIKDVRLTGLWQYDIGQTLDIMGLVPTGTPEMHWAYSALADLTPPQTIDIRTMTEVTTGEGEAAETYYTVDIPDLALSTADEVVGYVYDEGTGTGETIAVVRFYVEEREQPTDYAGVDDTVTLQGMIDTTISTTPHNNLASKQGGTTGQYYHLTSAQHTKAAEVLPNIITGADSTATGLETLKHNDGGFNNTAFGYSALHNNTDGFGNTAVGFGSLHQNTLGESNTGIGQDSGAYISNGITPNTTSDYGVYLGANTKALADNDQNEIVIGYNATGAGSNTATLGNESITKTVLRGDVQIGTKITDSAGTGAATGITPAAGDNSTLLATTAYVKGEISGAAYTLPTASASTLGGVKVGSGLTITDGVLAAAGSNVTIVDHVADLPEGAEGDLAIVRRGDGSYVKTLTTKSTPSWAAGSYATSYITTPTGEWTMCYGDDISEFTDGGFDKGVMIARCDEQYIYLAETTTIEGVQYAAGWYHATESGLVALTEPAVFTPRIDVQYIETEDYAEPVLTDVFDVAYEYCYEVYAYDGEWRRVAWRGDAVTQLTNDAATVDLEADKNYSIVIVNPTEFVLPDVVNDRKCHKICLDMAFMGESGSAAFSASEPIWWENNGIVPTIIDGLWQIEARYLPSLSRWAITTAKFGAPSA